ncbi:hypothetical protein F2Q68_00045080 [Brassica cretica]|uniref:Uncharacterized protein n=1 Tax=Brassica cretica TaxID=69181 RepID=A0A8S9LIR9_BRACR|nr:hypothetical protein F2Q68_00045080 [Brassica cretica]
MCRTSDPVKADYGMDIFADEIYVPEIFKGLGFVGVNKFVHGMDNVKDPVVNLLGRDNGISVVGTHDVYDHTHINDVVHRSGQCKELSVGARFRSDATRSLQPCSSWSDMIRATGPSSSHFRCPELESRSRSDVSQRPREVACVFCDWERRDQSDSAKSLAFRSLGLENRSQSDVSQRPREVARVFCRSEQRLAATT